MERGYWAYPAAVTALLVGWAVAFAGQKRRGPRLQLVALGIAALAMVAGQYLVINGLVRKFLREKGQPVPTLIGADLYWNASRQLRHDKDPWFFVVGLAIAGLVPHRRPAPRAPRGDPG
jgi:hypothetical protein